MKLSPPPIIAIDGGGTRCRIACVTGGSRVAVETGAANVSTDFDGAFREIERGLSRVAEKSGLPAKDLSQATAFVGLAGMVSAEIEHRVRARLPFARARIADDRPAALRGALGTRDGFIAHCGTGSFFAMRAGNEMRFAGGWGPVLGDEASAHAIAKTALSRTLDCADGLVSPSPMAEHFLNEFGGAPGIVRFAATATQADMAALAERVTQADTADDPVARSVLQEGARHVAETLRQLGWRAGQVICLTGGIGPFLAPHLPDDMQAARAAPEGDPLDGALALAQELQREHAP